MASTEFTTEEMKVYEKYNAEGMVDKMAKAMAEEKGVPCIKDTHSKTQQEEAFHLAVVFMKLCGRKEVTESGFTPKLGKFLYEGPQQVEGVALRPYDPNNDLMLLKKREAEFEVRGKSEEKSDEEAFWYDDLDTDKYKIVKKYVTDLTDNEHAIFMSDWSRRAWKNQPYQYQAMRDARALGWDALPIDVMEFFESGSANYAFDPTRQGYIGTMLDIATRNFDGPTVVVYGTKHIRKNNQGDFDVWTGHPYNKDLIIREPSYVDENGDKKLGMFVVKMLDLTQDIEKKQLTDELEKLLSPDRYQKLFREVNNSIRYGKLFKTEQKAREHLIPAKILEAFYRKIEKRIQSEKAADDDDDWL